MRLALKLGLLFVLVGLVPILVLSYVSLVTSRGSLLDCTKNHLLEVAHLKESELRRWIDSSTLLLETIATEQAMLEFLQTSEDESMDAATRRDLGSAFVETQLASHLTSGIIEALSILDAQSGQILASTDLQLVGRFRESEPFFVEGKHATFVGRVAYSVSSDDLVMPTSTPILDLNDRLIGVLSAHVDLAELSTIMSPAETQDHESEDIYLVNDFSFFVTEPLHGDDYALRRIVRTDGVTAALDGETGAGEYVDYRGEPVVGAYRWMPGLHMAVLAEIDRAEALAPILELQRTIIVLATVVATLIAVVAVVLSRGITRPVKRLMRGAKEIGGGNLAYRVQEKGRDELGRLSESFNRMAENLLTVTASRDDLEREVAARAAAELRLKHSIDALEQSESKFRLLTDSSPVGIFIFKDFIVRYVNPAFEKTFGYTRSELVGNLGPMDLTHPDDHETTRQYIEQCMADVEELAPCPFIGIRKDNSLVYCEAMARPIEYDGGPALLGTIVDVTARREAEAELHLKDAVFESSIAANSTANTDGLITHANASFLRLWGYQSKDEVIGRPLSDFLVDQDEVVAIVTTLNETGEWEGDFEAIRKDRSTFISNGHATVLRNQAGEIIGYQSANLDVTGQRNAEVEIRNSKEITESIIDSLPGAFYQISQEARFVRWNKTFETVTGYSGSEIAKMSPLDLFENHDRDQVAQAISRVFEDGLANVTAGFRSKDGTTTPYYFTGMRKLLGGIPFIIGMGTDITSLLEAETAVRESEEKFRALVETTSELIWEVDADVRYTYISPRVRDLLGYEPEELLGRRPFDLMTPEDAERVQQQLLDSVENYGPFAGVENTNIHKDGHHVVLETSGRPILGPAGELLGYRGIDRDITDRKNAETKLNNLLEELRRSNRELEQFAYVASHDLQEPLRMVSSYTQLLERRYSDALDDDAHDFINYAVDGANRMQRLISDLLDFSRVQTRGKPFERVDLNSILGHAQHNLAAAIDESLALVTHDELPSVMGDENQLVSVFQNLVSNAIKFRGHQTPKIHIGIEDNTSEWRISVEDNGIGIDSEFRDRIFVIFQRLHGRDEYSGTGIGLAMCKRIVERHGGRIWVESTPNEGATFFFTLPKRQEEAV